MPPFRSIMPWSIMPSGEPMPSISLETGGYRVGRRLRRRRSRRRLRKGRRRSRRRLRKGEQEQEERQCQASLQRREKALLHLCHSTVQH